MARQFTEEEAQRVFARLAELQGQGHGGTGTLSLGELEEAARAAGLDASLVSRAVADLDAPPERRRTLFGAPVDVVQSRVIPGALTDDVWADMVGVIRAEFAATGMAGELGRTREWTHISGGSKNGVTTRVSAEPTADGTRVTVSRSVRDAVLGFSLAGGIQLMMALMFVVIALASGEIEMFIPAGIMLLIGLVFAGGTQVGTRMWAKHRSEQFDRLLDRLEFATRAAEPSATDAAAPRAPEATGADRAAPALDPDAEDAFEGDGWTTPRRRVRS